MERYQHDVIFDLIAIYGYFGKIVERTCREFNLKYPHLPSMTRKKFARIKRNFCDFGKVDKPLARKKPVTEDEVNQVAVLGYFEAHPRKSIRNASADLGLSYATVQRILHHHKIHPYSFIRLQKLHPGDYQRRVEFCENFLIEAQEDENFLQRIIWTDEAKFCQRGVFNRRNRHFYARENPHMVLEVENQRKFSLNVFCMLMDNRFWYFIYNENLNGDRYIDIIRNVVEEFVDDLPLRVADSCWYQMDGAPAHSTRAVDEKLTELFRDRWWGNKGPRLWPPRSPDLTPVDYYLWGRIKELVYATPIDNENDLRLKITAAFENLQPGEIKQATSHSVQNRILECLNQNGAHIEHLL